MSETPGEYLDRLEDRDDEFEKLVRYVRALEEYWGEGTFPVGYTRKIGNLRKALSQELRDSMATLEDENEI